MRVINILLPEQHLMPDHAHPARPPPHKHTHTHAHTHQQKGHFFFLMTSAHPTYSPHNFVGMFADLCLPFLLLLAGLAFSRLLCRNFTFHLQIFHMMTFKTRRENSGLADCCKKRPKLGRKMIFFYSISLKHTTQAHSYKNRMFLRLKYTPA